MYFVAFVATLICAAPEVQLSASVTPSADLLLVYDVFNVVRSAAAMLAYLLVVWQAPLEAWGTAGAAFVTASEAAAYSDSEDDDGGARADGGVLGSRALLARRSTAGGIGGGRFAGRRL